MIQYLERACEEIDATLFNGDALHDNAALGEFKAYMERWQKQVGEIETIIAAYALRQIGGAE